MDIRPNQSHSEWDNAYYAPEGVVSELAAQLINNKNKKYNIRKSKIKDVANGLAEIAFNIGETNDPELFAEEMTENIFKALKKVEEKQKNPHKNH